MSLNSTPSCNTTLPTSPSMSTFSILHCCLKTTIGTFGITAFGITNILLLSPLYIFILRLSLQRWRQQRSNTPMSHADVFTYHMVVTELLSVFGSTLISSGVYTDLPQMMMVGVYLCTMNLSGQMLFHTLTCVERYLAVIHPVTYLTLRKDNGVTIRNICIACVWLLSLALAGVTFMNDDLAMAVISICMLFLSLSVVSFCSLSVLCALIRPGPGEGSAGRQQVDQSKLRAFYSITAILGVLLLKLLGTILAIALFVLPQLGPAGRCIAWLSAVWFGLPSSLASPLLFLHKTRKLMCGKNSNDSGQGALE